ncbi:MAG: T9SS type B sorting domain-containing protein [Bacteroidetes bacterium]|nr:T9SS type B sorting domain-containing protein [Bacteroidota bacterium]
MKKIFYKFIFIFTLFPCIYGYSQNTVIHDIPWKSDTVGMWGSGSTAWSINEIDTLFNFSIGPYGNSYSYVVDLPWPISDSVGAILDYGVSFESQLVFEMVGWSGGGVKVDYPTEITMDFPASGSFASGDMLTIQSDYRVQDTIVHPADTANWDIYANWPDAGKIELYLNFMVDAHANLMYSDPSDIFNITWQTINMFPPININLNHFDIFLIDVPNGAYTIPWVYTHTDPITNSTVFDSIGFKHDVMGMPISFPSFFYDYVGISGDITVPDITTYNKWIEDEKKLHTSGCADFIHLNLDIVKFVQKISEWVGHPEISTAMNYLQGSYSQTLFTDPFSGDPFDISFDWDILHLELMFTNKICQTLTFEDDKEYTNFWGNPIPPNHYPNVWNIFKFPSPVDYNVLDTMGVIIDSGTSDSIRFGADYDLQLQYPCYSSDSLPVNITHSIDPWLTNVVKDSLQIEFGIKVFDIDYSLGFASSPVFAGNYILYSDTFDLGTYAGPTLYGPWVFMPWKIVGDFQDSTFTPDKFLVPINQPLSDSLIVSNIYCYGDSTGSATAVAYGGAGPYIYSWTHDSIVISDSASIDNLSIGTYYLNVTDFNGCTINDSVEFAYLFPQLFGSHISTDVLCHGESTGAITLIDTGGSSNYSYTWEPNIGTDSVYNNLNAGTYYVTVTDDVGCVAFDSIVINEPDSALLISIIDSANVTCYNGNDGSININLSGGVRPYSFYWSNGDTILHLDSLIAGAYTITVTDSNACTAIKTINISEPGEIIVYVHNYSICYGQSVVIVPDSTTGGTIPFTYWWDGTPGSSMTVNPSVTTNYSVYAVDSNNCSGNITTFTIEVTAPLTIDVTAIKDSLCQGDSIQLFANITGGGGPPYIIYLDNGQSGASPITVLPSQTTSYIATVWDSCRYASSSDTILITVMPLPSRSFDASPASGCQPFTVPFNYFSSDTGLAFSWNFGEDSTIVTDPKPVYTYNNVGTYNVSLTVTTPFGCVDSITKNNMIEVWLKPTAYFSQDPAIIDLYNPFVNFSNLSSTTYGSLWDFGDGSTSTITSPNHQFLSVDSFDIMLVAISDQGCLDTAWSDVIVKDTIDLFVPNVFSPDGNGINDIFKPEGNIYAPVYKMIIFDRWGEKIFESTDILKGWDGTIKGKPINVDEVFVYTIIYKDTKGVLHKLMGDVTLLHTSP